MHLYLTFSAVGWAVLFFEVAVFKAGYSNMLWAMDAGQGVGCRTHCCGLGYTNSFSGMARRGSESRELTQLDCRWVLSRGGRCGLIRGGIWPVCRLLGDESQRFLMGLRRGITVQMLVLCFIWAFTGGKFSFFFWSSWWIYVFMALSILWGMKWISTSWVDKWVQLRVGDIWLQRSWDLSDEKKGCVIRGQTKAKAWTAQLDWVIEMATCPLVPVSHLPRWQNVWYSVGYMAAPNGDFICVVCD